MVRQSGNVVDLVGEEWWCLADSLAKEWQSRSGRTRLGRDRYGKFRQEICRGLEE